MAINPIKPKLDNKNSNNLKSQKVSFGNLNPVVTLMENIDRGGYITSFIAVDGCGLISPRICAGLYRNKEETGEYNWKFAATEAIRELLSGPCMIVIPLLMLFAAKKKFGSAHDVPVKFIGLISDDFTKFAQNLKPEQLKDKAQLKKGYYTDVMRRALEKVTDGKLKPEEVQKQTECFVDEILKAEKAPKKGTLKKFLNQKVEGSADDLMGALTDKFITLRKKYCGSLKDSMSLDLSVIGSTKEDEVGFTKFLKHLKNFTDDATNVLSTKFNKTESVSKFVEQFKHKRVSARFMLILGMDLAVAGFMLMIPNFYKHKDGNPGLKGLNADSLHIQDNEKEDV
jgi:hypothetical protein